ncbi:MULTISPECIES: DUF397 domain-containing protein [unclassified Streptomyces]|uniref:DUF397 domain-containing protein n=1 Tax=unclassified Streptomyces TaxID=2593676 RepID=UPI002DDC1117|nr:MULTISPECIES: DUF397 domain-containing protein [unclassified Streptomyces]WSA96779.1 DUF397 domain-containing protein [Streptomyces sp. NBC_01795]WSB81195.1 DUF397 domain-containing protein [Streptomyces sp. NBC_01775]WSS10597.1 DUF397 domain-containing protein [Streptomyces sp. NBC_01186]WSS39291.1 DUF397 domain-containing protein [Streptomyces sp. NBC_01187]
MSASPHHSHAPGPSYTPRWIRSSYSTGTNNCLEAARGSGRLAVRDSKDPARGALSVGGAAWTSFVAVVKEPSGAGHLSGGRSPVGRS